jgi:UDP-2,3-diacylglucosamine hydrolase
MFSNVVSLSSIDIQVPKGKEVVFFSDVHLGYGSKTTDVARENLLLDFLGMIHESTHHLFIVGDLFDFWFDYGTVIPKHHFRTLAALKRLQEHGIQITYLMGNHDFGHNSFFTEEMGITVERGDVEVTINGVRIYVAHGDGKAKNDMGYLILRSILRNRFAQWAYRLLHPDVGIWLASRTSHRSRDYTTTKEYGTEDGLQEFAATKIAEGFEYVVMGHRHQVKYHRVGSGVYVNLGHWIDLNPHYARFTYQNEMIIESAVAAAPQTV